MYELCNFLLKFKAKAKQNQKQNKAKITASGNLETFPQTSVCGLPQCFEGVGSVQYNTGKPICCLSSETCRPESVQPALCRDVVKRQVSEGRNEAAMVPWSPDGILSG